MKIHYVRPMLRTDIISVYMTFVLRFNWTTCKSEFLDPCTSGPRLISTINPPPFSLNQSSVYPFISYTSPPRVIPPDFTSIFIFSHTSYPNYPCWSSTPFVTQIQSLSCLRPSFFHYPSNTCKLFICRSYRRIIHSVWQLHSYDNCSETRLILIPPRCYLALAALITNKLLIFYLILQFQPPFQHFENGVPGATTVGRALINSSHGGHKSEVGIGPRPQRWQALALKIAPLGH